MKNPAGITSGQNNSLAALPGGKYRHAERVCWRCGKKTKVYTWAGKKIFGEEKPPEPIPDTVRFKFSKQAGHRYWVNTCFYCGSIQGDWFLYCEPDGSFFDEEKFEDFFEGGLVCI